MLLLWYKNYRFDSRSCSRSVKGEKSAPQKREKLTCTGRERQAEISISSEAKSDSEAKNCFFFHL